MKAVLTIGIPASGKTTWAEKMAREQGWLNTNRDDIRFSVTGHTSWKTYKFKKRVEDMVTAIQRSMIESAAKMGMNVIISDTNLNKHHRESLVQYLKDLGFAVEFEEFHISLEDAYHRDALRENGVGRDVIYSMYQRYLEYVGVRKHVHSPDKTPAICFDVDGTLAHMNGRRPFDWGRVGEDTPDALLIEIANSLSKKYKILVMTGRDGCCLEETKEWLNKHGLRYDDIFIREAGDTRKDYIIKKELFFKYVDGKYNVHAVFDDRPQVLTHAWLPMGIKTFTCGDFNINF